jgi:hypothetical protein
MVDRVQAADEDQLRKDGWMGLLKEEIASLGFRCDDGVFRRHLDGRRNVRRMLDPLHVKVDWLEMFSTSYRRLAGEDLPPILAWELDPCKAELEM